MQYATREPINLSANLSFEQTYDEIRGDSASLTELCALLSSLAEVPVRQGIAVTGSVDQQGRVQPVGGVSAKVEGFFCVCAQQGLTGDQGVIIPAINQPNLMLRSEVVNAVAEANFHIYPVSTVDEAIEVLTGMEAGKRTQRGGFTRGMFHARVASRLKKLARSLDGNRRSGQSRVRREPAQKSTPSKKEPKGKGKSRGEGGG
jgi:predicted ATP-dependent protease